MYERRWMFVVWVSKIRMRWMFVVPTILVRSPLTFVGSKTLRRMKTSLFSTKKSLSSKTKNKEHIFIFEKRNTTQTHTPKLPSAHSLTW